MRMLVPRSLGIGIIVLIKPKADRHFGKAWLWRCPPGYKFLFLLVISSVLLMLQTPWQQGVAFLAVLCMVGFCGLVNQKLWRDSRAFLCLLLWVSVYSFWLQGWAMTVVMVLRMMSLLLLALAIGYTTTVSQLMGVIESGLQTLDRRGWLDSESIALTFGLTLRLIPELSLQWQSLREAQTARGLDRRPLICIVPMIVATLKRAQEIADAIDARQLTRK